jgi:hypothetical protein
MMKNTAATRPWVADTRSDFDAPVAEEQTFLDVLHQELCEILASLNEASGSLGGTHDRLFGLSPINNETGRGQESKPCGRADELVNLVKAARNRASGVMHQALGLSARL